jgi:uncharacterized membrane protein YeaQ/YmgE (transglycosylase-associated protein family)
MGIYGKAILLGLLMGPVGGIIYFVLSQLGCPQEIALASVIGVLGAFTGMVLAKRDRSG